MLAIINFFMKNKLLTNLLVFLILTAGLTVLSGINREAFPDVNFDMVSITTIYPGGSPDELEQLVTIPLEKRLREVDGLDKVRSYNIENVSVIVVYIDDEVSDKKSTVEDIKDAIALEDSLPDKAEKPIVEEIKLEKKFTLDVAIYKKDSDTSYKELREVADDLEDYLYEIDGVAEVEAKGYEDREYLVEVDPNKLQVLRMSMNSVINTLRNRNMDIPGGSLRIGNNEYILRTKGQYNNINEILDTTITMNDMGFGTRVKDVAMVTDTFKEATVYERFNGHRAIVFRIWKKKSPDEIRLVSLLKNKIDSYKKTLPKNVKIEYFNNISRLTQTRVKALVMNAITGFILLGLILLLLLGFRMSAIVAAGIPISFMVAFMVMKYNGITLNVISMFAMIMVLGMIVDFGIVVSENCHRYMEAGMEKIKAIKKGVSEVVWPVTVTLLCISAAFAPLLFLSGLMGKFIKAIPMVLMICLTASWGVAMFVTPNYLSIFGKAEKEKGVNLKDEDPNFEKGIFGWLQHYYKMIVTRALEQRYLTLGVLFFMLIASLALVAVKQVKFVFFPGGGSEEITIRTKMPQGTNLQANLRYAREIEKIIMKLPKSELDALHATIGEETSSPLDPKPGQGTHKSTYVLYMSKEDDRERDAYEIQAELRKNIGIAIKKKILPDDMDIRVDVNEKGPPVGKPVNVEIRGKDFDVLKKIAKEYMDYLKKIKNVYDITMDLEEGKQEYRYVINDMMAARTNVSVFDAAMALNASYQGAVATSVRKGKDNIDIRVRFPEKERKKWKSLNKVMVGNRQGGLIPLNTVTNVRKQPGYSQINRLNFKRIVQVQANLDTEKITSREVNVKLMKKFSNIQKRYPGYKISYGGEQEDTEKSMGELGRLFLFALFVIYIILAVFFGSLILPVIVMIAIPFALVGIILALWVHGKPLSFPTTLGFFSLAGVIVSNTLVLVQFINYQREEGHNLKDALIEAGVIRLRPVLLTTGTTVLALFPTIYGLGGMDYFVAPLAMAFGYGLIFATFITMVLIPCFYYIAEDLKGIVSKLLSLVGVTMGAEVYTGQVSLTEEEDEIDESTDNNIVKTQIRKRKGK